MDLMLKKTQSSYYPAFRELYKETCYALEEALDIDAHLQPLVTHFELFRTIAFDENWEYFDPMFHVICLLWAHSKFYRRPARIIILLQEVNNLMMTLATEYLEPINLFKMDPEDSINKINRAVKSLEFYRKSYESHRGSILGYFKNGSVPQDWDFAPQLVFFRMDKFMERLNMIRVKI